MSARDLGLQSSWHMLTRDKGWLKPVLILALVNWIPIIGPMVLLGYALEWARLTAWGVDSAPKQHDINYGKILTTGFMATVVSVLLTLPVMIVNGVITSILPFLALLTMLINVLSVVVIYACVLHMTIYDRFSAGFSLGRIFTMISRDFSSFAHLCGIYLLVTLVPAVLIGFVVFLGIFIATFIIGGLVWIDSEALVIALVLFMIPVILLLVFIISVVTVIATLVTINAVGQWFTHYDVARWGLTSDPLPSGTPLGAPVAQAQTVPPVYYENQTTNPAQQPAQNQSSVVQQQVTTPVESPVVSEVSTPVQESMNVVSTPETSSVIEPSAATIQVTAPSTSEANVESVQCSTVSTSEPVVEVKPVQQPVEANDTSVEVNQSENQE